MLEYWQDDPSTDIVLLYLESFGNPRNFARAARRVSADKPVLAVHAGRSSVGARAAASHTGAAIAGSGAGVDALLAHAGVVRVETLRELFDAAALASAQPLAARRPGSAWSRTPAGPRSSVRGRLRGGRPGGAGAVEAAASGSSHDRSLHRPHDRLVIEGSFGLGEAVVSGPVSPDRYVVEKKILHIMIRDISAPRSS